MLAQDSVHSTNLRGAFQHAEQSTLSGTAAWSSDTLNATFVSTEQSRVLEESQEEKPFTIMLTVLVSFILVFFLICTYQVMRIMLCKCLCNRDVRPAVVDPIGTDDTMLVHEGRVFNLTGHQRRAVLEAIFSERSKAVTDQDVADEKKNKKRKKRSATLDADADDSLPMDAVEIPGVSTVGTDVSGNNHQNLSPTDSFGDVEMASNPRYDESEATLETLSSPEQLDDRQVVALDNCTSYLAATATFDHVYRDSDSVSDIEDEAPLSHVSDDDDGAESENGKGDTAGTEPNDGIITRSSSVEGRNHPDDENDSDDDDYKLSAVHSADRYGLTMGGGTTSFEGIWGESPSSSFSLGPLGQQGDAADTGNIVVTTTAMQVSDDDDVDEDGDGAIDENAKVEACRRALFRCGSNTADGETQQQDDERQVAGRKNTAATATSDGIEEFKEEMDNSARSSEIPGLEQVPSSDSFGNFCEYITPSNLQIPIPMTKRESFATITSEYTYDDDDTTGDNVCPICLCGYKKGDMLVVSHHCTHCFHKDCILEWLDKHDECPICRVNMVTNSELNRAATSLVGKTRMYRAVASLQSTSSSPASMRYRMQQNNQSSPSSVIVNGPSPFQGTVRSRSAAVAARTPPRGYQNPMAFS